MSLELTFFIASFAGLVLMLSLHSIEEKFEKMLFFHSTRMKADIAIKNFFVFARKHARNLNMRNFKMIAHMFVVSLAEAIHHAKDTIFRQGANISDFLKRKGMLRDSGSISFYLKNVSDYKDRLSH